MNDKVENDNDFVAGIDRLIGVGERLRFDALARIDQEDRTLARGERA